MKIDKIAILKKMVRIRLVEQYIARRYPEQKMKCPAHLCLGQEAAPAVFGYFAKDKDIFVGTYRSHGHYLAKKGDLSLLFAELLGNSGGCSGGFGGSMHIIDQKHNFLGTSAIVAGGIPIAAGAALSLKYRKLPYVTVVFLGDAAMEEGVVYETVNFALLHALPLIFVCENNRLAISTPLELRQSSCSLFNRFKTMGLKGLRIGENDIKGLIKASVRAYEFTRNNKGPFFIEYTVSRWSTHVGHDFDGPVDSWWQEKSDMKNNSCPLCAFIKDLIIEGLITKARIEKMRQDINSEIDNAYRVSQSSAKFPKKALSEYVYASGLRAVLPNQRKVVKAPIFDFRERAKLVNPF